MPPGTPLDSARLISYRKKSSAVGIFQSDLLIRGALIAALADLRSRRDLLDTVFATLTFDELTREIYGEKERDRAVEWFLSTEIPVTMDFRLGQNPGTCISIALSSSDESEFTLGDVHYDPTELLDAPWIPLTEPFDASYDTATGVFVLPPEIAAKVVLQTGMLIHDSAGRPLPIVEVIDGSTGRIQAGAVVELRNSILRYPDPRQVGTVESVRVRETYRVGCHAHGDPIFLTYLHSIVVFCLLRYKQALLEARGFERSTISSGPFAADNAFQAENMWTRFINVTGTVQHSWPKLTVERTRVVGVLPTVVPQGATGGVVSDPDLGAASPWLDRDMTVRD
jgi:hypothetical protein